MEVAIIEDFVDLSQLFMVHILRTGLIVHEWEEIVDLVLLPAFAKWNRISNLFLILNDEENIFYLL